ncbi:hypothetical protein EG329_006360 [Mollisiaceae sp. DMI_Dod_QoI]|nr:hypothetical protein EG329_006360 [Helotiales sp. DMI_Dod_QoI]
MAATTNSSFSRVYESFRRRLTPDQCSEFQYATVDDLKAAIEEIQKAQAQRRGLRNLNKLKCFVHGLEQYAGILEVFVQVKPDLLGLIWGPIKFCLQIASKAINTFDALLDAYQRIGASLPVLSAIDEMFYSKPHVQQVLANIYEDILDFHKRSVVFFSHGTWKITLKLAYNTLEDMFDDILKRLERSRDLLMEAASIAHFQEAQKERLFWIKDHEERVERDRKARMLDVAEWLSADKSYLAQQEALQRTRLELPESGSWIFKVPMVKDWFRGNEGSSLTLWLNGIPGAGKTVLFSSVIDEIHKSYSTSETVYFYCKNSDPQRSTFNAIARSLISQILQKDTSCLGYLYDTIIASGEYRPGTSALLKQILEELVICRNSLFIAIDGLDECEKHERSKIFSVVSNVSKECSVKRNIKFLLTSRKENDIRLSLHSAFHLKIEPQYVESDIKAYVELQASRLSKKFDFDMEREREIVKAVLIRPKGKSPLTVGV